MPHCMGNGLKLLEFGCSSNGTMTGLAILLAAHNGRGGGDLRIEAGSPGADMVGRWAGDKIIIAGDYGDHAEDAKYFPELPERINLYALCSEAEDLADNPNAEKIKPLLFKDISYDVIRAMASDGYLRTTIVENIKRFGGPLLQKYPDLITLLGLEDKTLKAIDPPMKVKAPRSKLPPTAKPASRKRVAATSKK